MNLKYEIVFYNVILFHIWSTDEGVLRDGRLENFFSEGLNFNCDQL